MTDLNSDKPKKKPEVSSLFETNFELKEADEKESLPDVADAKSGGDSEDDPLIGHIFADKYEVLSALGKGGMSTVYKVKHLELGMELALKVLHKHLWTDPLSVERFRLEAKTISKLSSPYLITFRDFGVSDGQPYLVMDYLEGVSLGNKIDQDNGLKVDQCVDIFEKLCLGLQEAHKNGITHRDIKPANVMFLNDGGDTTVKLVDFGIAKLADADQQMTLTQTGEVFGSPLYMSPEQCLGLTVDPRSDIYSLGCLFYETILGVPPLIGSSILDTMNAHIDKEPLDLMKANENLAAEANKLGIDIKDLNYVVMKCLQKRATDRYQSLDEVKEDLVRIKEKNPITRKQKLWKKTNPLRKALLASAAVVLVMMATGSAVYFSNPQFHAFVDGFAQQANWQYHQSMGKVASTLRDFEAAEAHYRSSLAIADNMDSPGEKHVKRLASLESLAQALQFEAKYPEQDKVVEEHKKELRQSLNELSNVSEGDESAELISGKEPETKDAALISAGLFAKLGKTNARNGRTKEAYNYYQKAYDLRKKWLDKGDEKLIESMDALALLAVIRGKRHQAGHLWEEAYRQAEESLSDDSKVKVSLYKNMGRIFQSVRPGKGQDLEKAEECYKKALELSKRHYGPQSKTTIQIMKDYAAFLNEAKRKGEAEKLWITIESMEKKS